LRAPVETTVNGEVLKLDVDPERPLLGVLRDVLSLTGTKYGCGEAQCGACTVLVDGHAVRSCVVPLSAVAGRRVTTIEGLARKDGALHPVQQAFVDAGAMQCGYCTPGMILSAVALLASKPSPTDEEIVRGMDGNVCRCGCYPRITAAIRSTAAVLRGGGK
jgi:aerobic-type carbon monoxide dehydrogenase small subunit (CoxS/CutS family)